MANSNEKAKYALITALYNDQSRGLYSDIYFPIIKYAIVKIYCSEANSEHYSSAEAVQGYIRDTFGIKIPHVVIVMTVKKIEAYKSGNIHLRTMSEGSLFQIEDALLDEDENTFEEREHAFNAHMIEIESEFKAFMENEGLADEDISFVQFMSDNTDNILGYLETSTETDQEEKYVSIVNFLDYLHRENPELFKVANQLFWSSILAAFLQSEKPIVNSSDSGVPSEYYLDTSLVMGLIGLSTPEKEQCAAELRDVINSAGGQLKVHPITLEEIKSIIELAETKGPKEGSPIASAYIRNKLTPAKLTNRRENLQKDIEKNGAQVFPNAIPDIRRKSMFDYSGTRQVRELAAKRSWSDNDYTYDDFREVHDIYMDDYIREQRKIKKGKDDIYFITSNRDLIDYCKDEYHPGASYMASPRSVVLDLWMHNTKPSDISSCMLTESMARCMDVHRSKVRQKVFDIRSYLKEANIEFDPDTFKELLRGLYRRAKNIIKVVEANPDDNPEVYMQNIKDALEKDSAHFESVASEMNSRNAELSEQLNEKSTQVEGLEKVSEEKSQQIGSLKDKNENLAAEKDKLSADLTMANKAVEFAKEEAATERRDKEAAQLLNKLYAERDELNSKLVQMRATLSPLEKDRQKSFCNWQPTTLVICGVVLVLVFGALVVLDKLKVYEVTSWVPYVTLVTLACALIGAGVAINTEDRRNRRKEKAFAKWEKVNSAYKDLMEQIAELENDLQFCKNQIKNSTAQK